MSHSPVSAVSSGDSSLIRPTRSSVFESVKMRVAQVSEVMKSQGWIAVMKQMIFFHRAAIVVEKDLAEITERPELLADLNLRVIEIDRGMLSSGVYDFAVRSRQLKANHYLDHGYGGFALVRQRRVIGDTWYVPSRTTNNPGALHKDLTRFGFTSWRENDAYTFDIFVAPKERKGKIAPAFQNEAMLLLRAKGYKKAFGFYWADNIPAHWCTRVTNKWKKVRTVSVTRVITFERAIPLPEM